MNPLEVLLSMFTFQGVGNVVQIQIKTVYADFVRNRPHWKGFLKRAIGRMIEDIFHVKVPS